MYEQVVTWAGLSLLLVLCLPWGAVHKLVLELSAWLLRLTLLALICGAAYLTYFPAEMPGEVIDTLNAYPRLRSLLPDPAAPYFAACLVAPVVVALLPLLAALDVTRKLAGRHLRRLRLLSAGAVVPVVAPPAHVPAHAGAVLRRIDRREAADALASLSARKPSRAAERRGL